MQSQCIASHTGDLFFHNLVNKLTAIICHCDILETHDASPECRSRAHKIKDLAEAASVVLYSRSAELQAENHIFALQQALTAEHYPKKLPRSTPAPVEEPVDSLRIIAGVQR